MFPRMGLAARIAPLVLAGACAFANPAAAFTDAEKAELGPIIREYLLKNPEVLEEAIAVLEQRHDAAQTEQRAKAMAELKPLLFDSPRGNVIGNPKGDVTLVEFFDYNCSYCQRALADLETLVKTDPNLRVVLREFPLLDKGSVEAAQVAIAVRLVAPEKYLDFHRAMFNTRGHADRAKAYAAAKHVGIDIADIEKQASSPELNATLDESMKLAKALGLNGTPSYVVGEQVVVGAVGADNLKAAIAEARKGEAASASADKAPAGK